MKIGEKPSRIHLQTEEGRERKHPFTANFPCSEPKASSEMQGNS